MWGVKIAYEICFLGTGGDSFVVGRHIRSAGGIILKVNDNQFHIDPGPGSLARASEYGINVRANNAILVSHNHLNHAGDINAIISAMTYNGMDKKGVLIANKTVINGTDKYQPFLLDYYKKLLERHIVLEAGRKVGINDIEIKALRTKHSDHNAIGFKFFTPHFTLAYSADTKYSAEIVEEYKNSNVLILNVVSTKKTDNNLCTEDAIKIIGEVNPRLAIIQHFGIEMVKADPLYEAREIQKQTKVHTIAAKDGMVLNPISYSVHQGQKTLYPLSGVDMPSFEMKEVKNMIKEQNKKLNDIFSKVEKDK